MKDASRMLIASPSREAAHTVASLITAGILSAHRLRILCLEDLAVKGGHLYSKNGGTTEVINRERLMRATVLTCHADDLTPVLTHLGRLEVPIHGKIMITTSGRQTD